MIETITHHANDDRERMVVDDPLRETQTEDVLHVVDGNGGVYGVLEKPVYGEGGGPARAVTGTPEFGKSMRN